VKPDKRLGCLKGGMEELKSHQWFKEIDFVQIYEKKIVAP